MAPEQARYSPIEKLTVPVLFALAFAVRCLPFTSVVVQDGPRLLSYDAYYHLRRVSYLFGSASTPLDVDPYVNFPVGAKPIWPWLFDCVLYWMAMPFAGSATPQRVAELLIWVPPLMGASCVVVLFWLSRRFFDFHTAWVAALLLSWLPAHVYYSRLSFIDHHVAVALGSTLMLAGALECLRLSSEDAARGPMLRVSLFLGAAFGVNLLVWPGAVMHVALIEVALFAALALGSRERACALARYLVLSNLIALALVAPFSAFQTWPQWVPFSPVVLSHFQPWFIAGIALTHACCWSIWQFTPLGQRKQARAGQTVIVGLTILAASALLFPDLGTAVRDSWEWISRGEVFQKNVAESSPLLFESGAFTTRTAVRQFSSLVYVFPFALVALAWSGRDRRFAGPHLLVAFFGLAFALTTLAQQRFQNSASVPFALILAWGLVTLFRTLSAWRTDRWFRSALLLSLVTACGFCLAPSLRSYGPLIANAGRAARNEAVQPTPQDELLDLQAEVARWLREHTPETSGLYDAGETPEYGILAPWGLGHLIQFVGERPAVVDNFGDDNGRDHFARAQSFHQADQKTGTELMRRLGARYVVLRRGRASVGLSRKLFHSSETIDPNFRLVFESTPRASFPRPEYRVFELVASTRARSRATPGR